MTNSVALPLSINGNTQQFYSNGSDKSANSGSRPGKSQTPDKTSNHTRRVSPQKDGSKGNQNAPNTGSRTFLPPSGVGNFSQGQSKFSAPPSSGGSSPTPQTSSAKSPTVDELAKASASAYFGGPPSGMKPFMVNGQPLTYTNNQDGVNAKVYVTAENQIVIAYQGTFISPATFGQIQSDLEVYGKQTTAGEKDSANFANQVISLAEAQGYSRDNIFVTGHSLGGIEAEYAASQTGLAGIGFDDTGLPQTTGAGNGSNFVNILTYGDPVSNYGSDTKGEQGGVLGTPSSGLSHYGKIVYVGDPANQSHLQSGTDVVGGFLNNHLINELENDVTNSSYDSETLDQLTSGALA